MNNEDRKKEIAQYIGKKSIEIKKRTKIIKRTIRGKN